jgi:hypothetical protein
MAASEADDPAAQAVRAAQQAFWDALQNKDRAAFEQVLADDFVARAPGEPDQDRTAFIDTLVGFPFQVRSIGAETLAVQVLGDSAVVMGVQAAEVVDAAGRVRLDRLGISNVYVWRGERWVLKLARTTPVKTP